MGAGNLVTKNTEKVEGLPLSCFLPVKSVPRLLSSTSLLEKPALHADRALGAHTQSWDQKRNLQRYQDSWLMTLWGCYYLQKVKSDKGVLVTRTDKYHTHLKEKEGRSGKLQDVSAHLCSWEVYDANVPEAISKHMKSKGDIGNN